MISKALPFILKFIYKIEKIKLIIKNVKIFKCFYGPNYIKLSWNFISFLEIIFMLCY